MKKILLTVPFLLVLTFVIAGCGQRPPQGFPKTVPFTVTLTANGQTVEGATIILADKEKRGGWTSSAVTDASGVAEFRTIQGTFVRKGAPQGSYAVTITKDTDVSSMITTQNDGSPGAAAAIAAEMAKLRAENPSEVDVKFNTLATSPVEISVSSGANEKIELNDYE